MNIYHLLFTLEEQKIPLLKRKLAIRGINVIESEDGNLCCATIADSNGKTVNYFVAVKTNPELIDFASKLPEFRMGRLFEPPKDESILTM